MRTTTAAAFASVAFAAQQELEGDHAARNTVILYQKAQEESKDEWVQISYKGTYAEQSANVPMIWNNNVSAFSVGDGLKVTFCDEPKCANED